MEDKFLTIAKQAALSAGKIISKYQGGKYQYSFKNKDKSDFATQADYKAEEIIIGIISKNFPGHNIIAEEGGRQDRRSEYTWAVDPLDGSFSFTAGVPYYSVSIGLLKNNYPILGVIYNISMKELYWAQHSKGAYLNGKKIHVSSTDNLEQAASSLEYGHRQKRQAKIDRYITPLAIKVGYIYSFGSAAVTLGMVASGILDIYVNEAWIWDFAAGAVIIREAGGLVTDFEGSEPDWSKQRLSIVSSNGLIHDEILKVLSPSLRGSLP